MPAEQEAAPGASGPPEAAAAADPALCCRGCGRPPCDGLDRKGRPFKTCCAGCAKGTGHDSACDGRAAEAAARITEPPQPPGAGTVCQPCLPKEQEVEARAEGGDDPPQRQASQATPEEGKAELEKRAFRAAAEDDTGCLAELLRGVPPGVWSRWKNGAGMSLFEVAIERGSQGARDLIQTKGIIADQSLADAEAAAAGWHRPLCGEGCGRLVAPGLRHGRPWKTCCRGCAQGRDHDPACAALCAKVVLCSRGCGLPVAPRQDPRGRPFQTCCRGCAVGEAHDEWCQAAPQTDEDIARQLRAFDEARLRSLRARRRRIFVRFRDAATCLWDPVWGQLELHEIDEGTPEDYIRRKKRQNMIAFCYVVCPSLVVGFSCCLRRCLTEVKSGVSPADARRGWTRYFCSISFLLALPMIAYVLLPFFVVDDYTNYKRHDVYGAKNAAKIVYEGEWWRLLTPIMLHTGWFHLVTNLGVQLRAAITLEYLWGHHIWLVIYAGSGAYGNLVSCAYFPHYISVGASGALCGLIGAWPVYLLMTWDQVLLLRF
ncbi:unnamed protein product [Prorocentrum cordatum]|uniref:Rhomboid-like protease n=1 Tax=Prorocentrum cordatum TaxID=2364126 RepID=A0ABN9V707_9DINO|nr:unnamed protein product [Polarella glacialis]